MLAFTQQRPGRTTPQRCAAWRSATRSSMTSAWRSSQASPGSWYMRATSSPAARRWRMTAMSRRLAAAFCSRAQVVAGRVRRAYGLGHNRVRAGAVAACGLAVGAHQHREEPPPPWRTVRRWSRRRSSDQPRSPLELVFARCYAARGQLSAICQQRSHARPLAAMRCPVL